MKIGKQGKIQSIYLQEDSCDLSNANMAFSLSSADLDHASDLFHMTFDRLYFQKPLDIIVTVLKANGYVPNLENILTCLDHLTIAIKGNSNNSAESTNDAVKLKTFLPCLVFKMPSKSHSGLLLQKFYEEIANYEFQLKKLQSLHEKNIKGDSKKETINSLREEAKFLKEENKNLKQQIGILQENLKNIERHHSYNQHLAEGNILPENIRIAQVRGILLAERMVVLRIDRKSFHLPMKHLNEIPEVGNSCLVYIKDGKVESAYFYQQSKKAFVVSLGEVLSSEEPFLKIRDHKRNTVVLEAANKDEKTLISNLKRGNKVLLYHFNSHIIRFEKCEQTNALEYQKRIQEKIAISQIDYESLERFEESMPQNSTKKNEVA
ncbi:MAG: hypothetical protein R3B45_04010 [Bdellovibrionota bacterium]